MPSHKSYETSDQDRLTALSSLEHPGLAYLVRYSRLDGAWGRALLTKRLARVLIVPLTVLATSVQTILVNTGEGSAVLAARL